MGEKRRSLGAPLSPPAPDRLRDAVGSLEEFTTKSIQSGKIQQECLVSPRAPVAQVDRAAVS